MYNFVLVFLNLLDLNINTLYGFKAKLSMHITNIVVSELHSYSIFGGSQVQSVLWRLAILIEVCRGFLHSLTANARILTKIRPSVEGSCEHSDEPSGSLKLLGIF
jgi:hypothetical protein